MLQLRGLDEVYRAIFAFDLGARMQRIKARTLIIEVAIPQEKHLGRQGEKLKTLIAGSRLATVEHTKGGTVVEVEAEQLAKLVLGLPGRVVSIGRLPVRYDGCFRKKAEIHHQRHAGEPRSGPG